MYYSIDFDSLTLMKSRIIFPKSISGKYSVSLIFGVPVFFYIGMSFVDFYVSVPAGVTISSDIIARPGIALPMLIGFIFGIAAFVLGVFSITKEKDRSILVVLSTALGLFVLLWSLSEIIFPH
jgi:hypothetical protein